MSLINDALKRASQSHKDQPRDVSTNAPMEAVEPPPSPSRLPIVLSGIAVLALAATGILVWRVPKPASPQMAAAMPVIRNQQAKPVPAVTAAPTAPESKPQAPVATPVQAAVAAAPPPAASPVPVQTPTVASAPPTAAGMPTNAAPGEPIASNSFPDLRVTAIIFRGKDPLAIVNGKTVSAGDSVDGVRVIKIHSKSVTLDFNGQVRDIPMD